MIMIIIIFLITIMVAIILIIAIIIYVIIIIFIIIIVGVTTTDILTAYIQSIQALRVLDPSCVILEIVTAPVKRYLRLAHYSRSLSLHDWLLPVRQPSLPVLFVGRVMILSAASCLT